MNGDGVRKKLLFYAFIEHLCCILFRVHGLYIMRKGIAFIVLLALFSQVSDQHYADYEFDMEIGDDAVPVTIHKPDIAELLDALQALDPNAEDSGFSRRRGWRTLAALTPSLKEYYLDAYDHERFLDSAVCFPVQGGHLYDVGGTNGSGYRSRHHAHDIFVKDRDYDCRNDATGEAYYALAMRSAVVLFTFEEWQPGSELKAGNHVWLYNPSRDILLYYAHLDQIMVNPGDVLEAGAPIGTIGRSGKNAYQQSSPTHVHVMTMHFQHNRLSPYNFYQELVESTAPQNM